MARLRRPANSAKQSEGNDHFVVQELRMIKFLLIPVVLWLLMPISGAQDAAAGASTAGVSAGPHGLLFTTADGASTLRVHGYIQADDRMFSSNTQGEGLDVFLFRRIRPVFEGTLFRSFDYQFMPDFGSSNPQIQDAYIEWKPFALAKLRIGKFKEPIGLEVLRSDRDLSLTERSLASDLLPSRYMGAQLGGSTAAQSIEYAIGYFNGSNDGSNGNFQWLRDNEFAGRVFLRPFVSKKVNGFRNFGFGLAGSAGSQRGAVAGLKTVAQTTFLKYASGTVGNGRHNRISPQAGYYAGPMGALLEYVVSSQNVLNRESRGELSNTAWQISGSVMLTGEKNGYNGIRPRHSFNPSRGVHYLGALELAIRYSELSVDNNAFPIFANAAKAAREARERGIGVNWYCSQFVKLTADYEQTSFRMASSTATPLHNENVLMSRIQLAF
jgi:phosphate-selective porin OprO and OprP